MGGASKSGLPLTCGVDPCGLHLGPVQLSGCIGMDWIYKIFKTGLQDWIFRLQDWTFGLQDWTF